MSTASDVDRQQQHVHRHVAKKITTWPSIAGYDPDKNAAPPPDSSSLMSKKTAPFQHFQAFVCLANSGMLGAADVAALVLVNKTVHEAFHDAGDATRVQHETLAVGDETSSTKRLLLAHLPRRAPENAAELVRRHGVASFFLRAVGREPSSGRNGEPPGGACEAPSSPAARRPHDYSEAEYHEAFVRATTVRWGAVLGEDDDGAVESVAFRCAGGRFLLRLLPDGNDLTLREDWFGLYLVWAPGPPMARPLSPDDIADIADGEGGDVVGGEGARDAETRDADTERTRARHAARSCSVTFALSCQGVRKVFTHDFSHAGEAWGDATFGAGDNSHGVWPVSLEILEAPARCWYEESHEGGGLSREDPPALQKTWTVQNLCQKRRWMAASDFLRSKVLRFSSETDSPPLGGVGDPFEIVLALPDRAAPDKISVFLTAPVLGAFLPAVEVLVGVNDGAGGVDGDIPPPAGRNDVLAFALPPEGHHFTYLKAFVGREGLRVPTPAKHKKTSSAAPSLDQVRITVRLAHGVGSAGTNAPSSGGASEGGAVRETGTLVVLAHDGSR